MDELINNFLYNDYKIKYNYNDIDNIFSCLNNDDFYKTALYKLETGIKLYREGICSQTEELKNEIIKQQKEINKLNNIINIYKSKYNINEDILNNLNDYLLFKDLLLDIKQFFNITFPFIVDKKILYIDEDIDNYDFDIDNEYNKEDYENDNYNEEDYLKISLKMKQIKKYRFDMYLKDVYKLLNLFLKIDIDDFVFLINSSPNLIKLFKKYKKEFENIDIYNNNYYYYFKDLINDFNLNFKRYKNININININNFNINFDKLNIKFKNNIDNIINIFDGNKIIKKYNSKDYYNSFCNLFEFLTKYIN